MHVLLQTNSKTVSFGADLFHVPIRIGGRRSHLIGICRNNRRSPPTELRWQAEAALPAHAQTLELQRLPSSHSGPRSAISASSQNSSASRSSISSSQGSSDSGSS